MVAISKPVFADSHVANQDSERSVAIVLNVNARKVDQETLGLMRSMVSDADLYISRRPEDGKRIADEVVAKGYDAVLWGGGDGTFAAGVAALLDSSDRLGLDVPDVGVLPFGTGNAVAWSVGKSSSSRESIANNLDLAKSPAQKRQLQMLRVEGQPTVFCGFGLDAEILEDLGKTVGVLRKVGLEQTIQSAGLRYFLTVSARSVPRFVASQRTEIVAINRGSPAIKVDAQGNQIGAPVLAGRVLWRGMATLASCGSIPYYGLGLKMFPQAEKTTGRFQVRLADASALEMISNLPKIWRGEYDSPRIHDFLVDEVELVAAKPTTFQSGGDVVGSRERMTVSLWDRPIDMV